MCILFKTKCAQCPGECSPEQKRNRKESDVAHSRICVWWRKLRFLQESGFWNTKEERAAHFVFSPPRQAVSNVSSVPRRFSLWLTKRITLTGWRVLRAQEMKFLTHIFNIAWLLLYDSNVQKCRHKHRQNTLTKCTLAEVRGRHRGLWEKVQFKI